MDAKMIVPLPKIHIINRNHTNLVWCGRHTVGRKIVMRQDAVIDYIMETQELLPLCHRCKRQMSRNVQVGDILTKSLNNEKSLC